MSIRLTLILLLLLNGFVGFCGEKGDGSKKREMIYVGTFSERGSLGIYV